MENKITIELDGKIAPQEAALALLGLSGGDSLLARAHGIN
jgi:hypothetical protein